MNRIITHARIKPMYHPNLAFPIEAVYVDPTGAAFAGYICKDDDAPLGFNVGVYYNRQAAEPGSYESLYAAPEGWQAQVIEEWNENWDTGEMSAPGYITHVSVFENKGGQGNV